MGLLRRKKTEILEEKAEFAESIKQMWIHGNYEKIKEAHNDILAFLKEKEFDFFSVQYLLTMTYMELLISEYMKSHATEIQKKILTLMGDSDKSDTPK